MNHQEWENMIPFYLAKTLPAEQVRVLERHLGTCTACQRSMQEWQMIASAVWAEAQAAAKRPPPLAAGFYERLAPRDPSAMRMPAAARQQGNLFSRRAGRVPFGVPLTMVAGLALTLIFGALLLSGAFRNQPDDREGQAIALLGTGEAIEDSFGAMLVASPQPFATHTPDPYGGILPTPYPTNTPTAQTPPIGGGMGGGGDLLPKPSAMPPPTEEAMMALSFMAEVGPFITMTPGLIDGGYHLCMLFNPTSEDIPVYAQASLDAEIVVSVIPGAEYRTLVRSDNGWYMVYIGIAGWVNPEQAYLRGNCAAGEFWVPTPTQTVEAG